MDGSDQSKSLDDLIKEVDPGDVARAGRLLDVLSHIALVCDEVRYDPDAGRRALAGFILRRIEAAL